MKKFFLLLFSAFLLSHENLSAQQTKWPREISFAKTGGKIIIYQPQPDALEGITLTGRAAIAGKEKSGDELVFGAMFFEAKLFTDKASRKASLTALKITNIKITGVDDEEKIKKLVALIEAEVPKWNLEISLDQITSTIKKQHPNAEVFNNTPPKIIYKESPTILVILDGEPKIQNDKDLDAERVVNSPYLIFKEGTQWNMYIGGTWYRSAEILKGWTATNSMSKKVKSINDQIKKQEKENNDNKEVAAKAEATDIIVSTEPAELIQTKGKSEFKPIDSTTLQYVSNSPNDIFKTADGQIYILIAGRWYKSSSMKGPWTFNESDKMPADFSRIPEGSEKDNVLVSISGTDAAEEAIIDAEIPQTAKVDRKTATVKVEYDGEPKFEPIEGCSLQLAANASLTVLKEASGNYFALDNGVWFVSNAPKGPWKVADVRPSDVEKIPAKSAAYNAKFVQIYESTPEYVIAGYTAGYLGSYVQGDPTIVFGTGFYYQPWYGAYYYPRPSTWGYGFSYNPWTGWSMCYVFNVGFLHIGFHFGGGYHGGWFGPALYRPPYRPLYHGGYYRPMGRPNYPGRPGRPGGNNIGNNINVNINNNHNNIYLPGRPGGSGRPGVINRPGKNGNGTNFRPNLPNRPNSNNNSNVPGRPGGIFGDNKPIAKPSNTPNNVFSDKSGNIFQRDKQGNINQRDNKTNIWKPSQDNNTNNNIRREARSRDRSNQQTRNFNNIPGPATGSQTLGNSGKGGGFFKKGKNN